jgi:hypothetical protein
MLDKDTQSARSRYLAFGDVLEDGCTGTDDDVWWKEFLQAVGWYIGVHLAIAGIMISLALVLFAPIVGLIALIDWLV